MFEKESEEYAVLNARQYIHNEDIGFCTSEEEVRQAYQKGAEFGYNKANEWHDLKEFIKDCPYSALKLYANGYYVEQLTKAKEIIQKLCDIVCGRSGDDWGVIKQAEQFLREVEE